MAKEPLPELGVVAVELGTAVSVDTSFSHCTDPDGGSIGFVAGVGLRPAGNWAGVIRGGALLGVGPGRHEDDPVMVRRHLWAGVGIRGRDRSDVAFGVTPFVSRTLYDDGAFITERWGGGLSFDMYQRSAGPGLTASLRFSADEHGASGGFSLGYGLTL